MYNPSLVTLNLKGPLRLIIAAFYQEDSAIDIFLESFNNSLRHKETILDHQKFVRINGIINFFRELRSKYDNYNSIMIITHGKVGNGAPTYEETKTEKHPIDNWLENWDFICSVLHDAAVDCLGFLAICNAGQTEVVDLLTRGQSQFLHMVTAASGKPLPAVNGAKAMALFIDHLADMNKDEYTPEDLAEAAQKTNESYPDVIKLWLYGDTIDFKAEYE